MKTKKKKNKKLLFNPDEVVTLISQDISRDLLDPLLAYKGLSESQTFYMSAQISSTLKKYVHNDQEKQSELEEKTYLKFMSVNSHMGNFRHGKLCLPKPRTKRLQSDVSTRTRILLRAKAMTNAILRPFSEEDLFDACKNSSGTSQGVSFIDTSNEAKFTFPITCSETCLPMFYRYLEYDSVLKDAIERFNAQNPTTGAITVIDSTSRATTVEKKDDIRRMIAIECTADMFFQQGLMHIMYKNMALSELNVVTLPSLHQQLARTSSITGKKATIDWSSASDCSAIDYVRWLLPPDYLYVAECTRSKYVEINNVKIELNMYSTMGNAVTFPLESVIFWTLMQACHNETLGYTNSCIVQDRKACSIFGDDCILPIETVPLFLKSAKDIGFILNDEKSFYEPGGGFRESCGGDYYHGCDVRPFCIKAPEQRVNSFLEPWLYTICNKILKKYIMYFGSLTYIYDKRVFVRLFSLFEQLGIEIKLVPSYFPDDAGLKWSFDLQRLVKCYKLKLAKITCDRHGAYRFSFCNFRYIESDTRDAFLSYALWLRQPITGNSTNMRLIDKAKQSSYTLSSEYDCSALVRSTKDTFLGKDISAFVKPLRKKGGYVVATGFASNWHVPVLF